MAALAPLTLLISLLAICHHALAFNILAISSLPLRSHYMAFEKLFNALAVRGHHVTVINNFPEEKPPKNMEFIDMEAAKNFAGYISPLESYENFDSTYLHLYNLYRHLELGPDSTKADCENFFTNENLKAHMAKGVKYDVIFVEMFMGDCSLAFAGTMFDAPIIGITSHVMLPTAYNRLGIPFDIGSDSFYFSKGGPNPTLYHKVENFFMNQVFNNFNRWYLQRIIKDMFKERLPDLDLDIEKVAKERMKMFFSYQHFSLTGSRLLSPQVLEIGGMHIAQPKPVPKDIEKFLSDAEYGAIYVSFGSNLKANTMSPEKLQEFLDAFKSIPQKVIWKFENNSLPEPYEKLYTNTWLPQLDILCHPKVLAFVSHGGMLSLSEAAHCGKPVITIPFFGDQFSNGAVAEHLGIGRVLHFDQLTSDSLARTIWELLSPKMQETAKNVSKRWHDRPMPALESAIFWTEYVARHRDSPPPLPSTKATWYENMLLDVAAVFLGIYLVIYFIIASILKLIKCIIVNTIGRLFISKKTKKD